MATHDSLRSMSIEAIEEYLVIAEHCVTTVKTGGGVYGYPAALLLCCVVDVLSNYAGHPENSLGELQSTLSLTPKQAKDFKNWYRNLLTHQAIIMPGTQLWPDLDGSAIEFGRQGEPTVIRVGPFCRAVREWWNRFDKSSVRPKFHEAQAPKVVAANTSRMFITSHLHREEFPEYWQDGLNKLAKPDP
jgi:hypothetical protein